MNKWGWLVVVAALVLRLCILAVISSYGVFLEYFITKFPSTPVAFLESIGAVSYGIGAMGAPISLALYRKYKTRRVVIAGVFAASLGFALTGTVQSPGAIFVTYGILLGIGALLTNNTSLFLIAQYFKPENKYYVLATSLPVPSIAFALERLVRGIGSQNAFALLGVNAFICGTLAALAMEENENGDTPQNESVNAMKGGYDGVPEHGIGDYQTGQKNEADNEKQLTETHLDQKCSATAESGDSKRDRGSAPSKPLVVAVSVTIFLTLFLRGAVMHSLPFVMVKHLVQEFNTTPFLAASTVTFFNLSDLCGRLTVAFIGDRFFKGHLVEMCAVCALLLGAGCLAARFAVQFYQMLMFNIGAGYITGFFAGTRFSTIGETLDHWNTEELYSISRVGAGLGTIVGNILAGALYDVTGSYRICFVLNLGFCLLVAMSFGTLVIVRERFLRRRVLHSAGGKESSSQIQHAENVTWTKKPRLELLSRFAQIQLQYNTKSEEKAPLKKTNSVLEY
ncbi:monocarboxylate transporter 7 [Lingula anatina]|uniref:Monocarboxylate transporter 7 n=1 Tax=Lingula anatina TaxID=7574 RepID=A0A1S3IM05_LINAN|nr:monocarboxylate transporter 7 [Lingula anatina]|eukprot:XP_013398936.1 monocarboxylate transporter 7 [Lingula anatina]